MKLGYLEWALLAAYTAALALSALRPIAVIVAAVALCALAAVVYIRLRDAWKEERVAAIEKLAKESAAAVLKLEKRTAAMEHIIAAAKAQQVD